MLFHFSLLYLLAFSSAFQIYSPKKYTRGEEVELLFNKIESDNTQLPYRYHDLPFVCFDQKQKAKSLSLGEILRGDRFWGSLYKLRFGIDEPCVQLCEMITNANGIARADSLIRNGYVVHWSLDGLPGATTFTSANHGSKYYAAGFPLGFISEDIAYLYNHVTIVVRYHREKKGVHAIVGFEIYPKSVEGNQCPGSFKHYKNFPMKVVRDKSGGLIQQKVHIPYTYSVYWREDNSVTYEDRWDLYYDNDNYKASNQIHWLSLVNSVVLVCLVSMVVAVVMLKLLKTDLQSEYSIPFTHADTDPSMSSSGSWKNLVNYVMRRPPHLEILSIICASGVQCLVAVISVSIIFFVNNNLSFGPGSSSKAFFNNHQGAFFNCSIVILLASGFVSSFFGIIFHKFLSNVPQPTVYTPTKTRILSLAFSGLLPFTILSSVLFINLFVWAKESSNALPFGTIVVILLLFGIIELPLGVLGGELGNRMKFSLNTFSSATNSTKASKFSEGRSLFISNPFLSTFAFGLIPFGIVYVDLLFIFNSVWLEKTTFYYMYGFLLLTTILLVVVIAESSIVGTYISLTFYNNPNWHWPAFRIGSSVGWYVFAYSIYYFVHNLHMSDFVSILVFFVYMALVSIITGASFGAVGVVSSFFFISTIYGAAKRD